MNIRQEEVAKRNFKKLLDSYGGECAQLARAMEVTQEVVRKWKSRGFMSVDGAIRAADRLDVSAKSLRPDLPIQIGPLDA